MKMTLNYWQIDELIALVTGEITRIERKKSNFFLSEGGTRYLSNLKDILGCLAVMKKEGESK